MTDEAKNILQTLKDKDSAFKDFEFVKAHSGSTEGFVVEISDGQQRLAIKKESKENIKKVKEFLDLYREIKLFPDLKYFSSDGEFLVYEFIEGDRNYRLLSKQELSFMIKEVFNKYKTLEDLGLDSSNFSAYDLLNEDLEYLKEVVDLDFRNKNFEKIKNLNSKYFKDVKFKPYLVHGDLGVHNLIFDSQDVIKGVIDPKGFSGLPILDFLYLLASKPHKLSKREILDLVFELNDISGFKQEEIIEIYKIALYIRISIAHRHHPKDLGDYYEIFEAL